MLKYFDIGWAGGKIRRTDGRADGPLGTVTTMLYATSLVAYVYVVPFLFCFSFFFFFKLIFFNRFPFVTVKAQTQKFLVVAVVQMAMY